MKGFKIYARSLARGLIGSERFDETFLCIVTGHSRKTCLPDALGSFSCGTIEQDFAVTKCDTLLSKTIVRHPYGADALLKAARS